MMRESVVQRRQTVVLEEESREGSATPTELLAPIANNCVGNNSLGGESDHTRDTSHTSTDIASTTIDAATTATTTITTAIVTSTTSTNNDDNANIGKDVARDGSNINVILIYNTRL